MVPQRRRAARSAGSKTAPRDGRQDGRSVSDTEGQSESQAPVVLVRAKQGAESQGQDWSWVEATVWSERMLAALGNGVKGGRWFSLIDKVYRIETLKAAWHKVEDNAGAAGVDGQSVERFGDRAEMYLKELSIALERGSYRPMPVPGRDFQRGWQAAPVGNPGGQRPHRTDGAEVCARTHL